MAVAGVRVTGTSAPNDDNANRITVACSGIRRLAVAVSPAAKIIGRLAAYVARTTTLLD
jgi:hypothetical protein